MIGQRDTMSSVRASRSRLQSNVRRRNPEDVRDKEAPSLYPPDGLETYVLSIHPKGYEVPVHVAVQIGSPSIDVEAVATPEGDVLSDFRRESSAFSRLLPSLITSRLGWFVAVRGREVIDEDQDEIALAKRMEEKHRRDFVLIRRVCATSSPDYLESPESELP